MIVEQDEEVIAKAAIEYLISLGKEYEVLLLLRCQISIEQSSWDMAFPVAGEGEVEVYDYSVALSVPPDRLNFYRNSLSEERRKNIAAAFLEAIRGAIGTPTVWVRDVNVHVRMAVGDVFPEWRETYLTSLRGDNDPLNEAVVATASAIFNWNGLRFRSRTEAVLAAALAKAKVLFFPLPAAVSELIKREPDFLICVDGKWGILEIHGEPFHPPETAAKESDRRRWFVQKGIKVMEFYDATRCYRDPDGVVREFLTILKRS